MSELIQLRLLDMHGATPAISPSNGCFIAGGAVRSWFTGKEEVSDIDVFAPTAAELSAFAGALKDAKQIDDHKNATTYDVGGVRVQLIKVYRPNVSELLENFDFNVCQFAWDANGIWATPQAVVGVLRGHLEVGKISHDFAADSLRRAFKYQNKGFYPCSGTIRDIALSIRELTEEEIKSQIEMSPKGGSRIVRFD